MAIASKLKGKENIILQSLEMPLLQDGMAFEGMNHAGVPMLIYSLF
jgi:hypothetical protein